jgi:phospho-N-acetylmuramoyl-pentapeptide-transferase
MTWYLIRIGVSLIVSFLGFYGYLLFSRRRVVERAVREETGERHAAKKHVPDMAGIVMLVCYAILVPIFDFHEIELKWPFFSYLAPIAFGLLGLADDLVKNLLKNTRGIHARFRIVIQLAIAVIYVMVGMHLICPNPIMGILIAVFLLATVNAANFTDGLDGLLTGSAIIPLIGFLFVVMTGIGVPTHGHVLLWWDLNFLGQSIIFICILAVFLCFNHHPAKMFMGDGGSMFIGAFLAIFAIHWNQMVLFLIMAFVIYFELLSVVLQVISYKLTKKRIFPMTPFHHSFEKWGWKESKIVMLFYCASLAFTVLGIFLAKHLIFFMDKRHWSW